MKRFAGLGIITGIAFALMLWGCGGGGGGGGSTPAATYHAYVTNISDQPCQFSR